MHPLYYKNLPDFVSVLTLVNNNNDLFIVDNTFGNIFERKAESQPFCCCCGWSI